MDLLSLSFRIALCSLKLPFVTHFVENFSPNVGGTIGDFDFFMANVKLVL